MIEIVFKILPGGGFLKQHILRNAAMNGQVAGPAPSIIVFIDGHLGHGVRGYGICDVHTTFWNQIHQSTVFSVRVHGEEDSFGMEGLRGLPAPGNDLFFKIGGIRHHVVHVCGPQDDIRGGIRKDGEQLIIGMLQGFCQFSHLFLMIIIMIIEGCGAQKGFLDEMHGRRTCDPKPLPHCHAILPDALFPPEKTLVSRFQGEIPEDVR